MQQQKRKHLYQHRQLLHSARRSIPIPIPSYFQHHGAKSLFDVLFSKLSKSTSANDFQSSQGWRVHLAICHMKFNSPGEHILKSTTSSIIATLKTVQNQNRITFVQTTTEQNRTAVHIVNFLCLSNQGEESWDWLKMVYHAKTLSGL